MFTFIQENLGSLLVLFGLLLIASLILITRIRAKRRGAGGCGCGCKSCPMAAACHKEKKDQT